MRERAHKRGKDRYSFIGYSSLRFFSTKVMNRIWGKTPKSARKAAGQNRAENQNCRKSAFYVDKIVDGAYKCGIIDTALKGTISDFTGCVFVV